MYRQRGIYLGMIVLVVAILTILGLACSSPQPTATAVSQPTAAPTAPAAATSTPRPTVVQPTATQVTSVQPKRGGILRTSTALTLRGWDPAAVTGGLTNVVGYLIYNNVVQVSNDLEIIPDLARSWDISSDGKVITFHIQPGVKFQDGTPLNAQAVKWNFDRQGDPEVINLQRHAAAQIAKVETPNDTTVVITLKTAFRPFLSFLAELPGMMVSPAAVQKAGSYKGAGAGSFNANPSGGGSGPFQFKEWIPERHIKIERNPNYWEAGKPYLDGITWNISFDATVRDAMVRTGEIDTLDRLTKTDAEVIRRSPNVVLDKWSAGAFASYSFVVTAPPFDKKALRQAIAYATDRQTLIDFIYGGDAEMAYSMIGAGWAKNPSLKVYEYSLQKSKEKLAEAGYPNGVTIPMFCPSTAEVITNCEFWQAMLDKASIKTDIKLYPASEGRQRRSEGSNWFTTPGDGLSSPTVDPYLNLQSWLGCKGGQADTKYCNSEYDRLLDESGREFDIAKAKVLYDKIQMIMMEDAPKVFIAWPNLYTARASYVRNYVYNKDNDARYRDVWLDR